MSHKGVHSINEKKIRFTPKYAFWYKNHFSEILKFIHICWSDIVGAFGFLGAVDMD